MLFLRQQSLLSDLFNSKPGQRREPAVCRPAEPNIIDPENDPNFDKRILDYIPVTVMLPLDVISPQRKLSDPNLLRSQLMALRSAGVDGVMVDVWWGLVESDEPCVYNWEPYVELFQMAQAMDLKVQPVMSFHQCGGNTGDSCYIPLPAWVLKIGEEDRDIFFTNRTKRRNMEYLSLGVDDIPVLAGRTVLEVYHDFMSSFRAKMEPFFATGVIRDVEIGLGPAGELRYPSYPETHGWRFPGIGEFQCYDRYLLARLRARAEELGNIEWGLGGPHDAGGYNDWPQYTGFFCNEGSYRSPYGRFFLEWYSGLLVEHGDKVLTAAGKAFAGTGVQLVAKVAGVHWWYNSHNHAAELAAGYYNLRDRDGYAPIAAMLAKHEAVLNFTCVEMRDFEQFPDARCGPEGLVNQVKSSCVRAGIEFSCENALPRFDPQAFDHILYNARSPLKDVAAGEYDVYGLKGNGTPLGRGRIASFTFLRLCKELFDTRNWNTFLRFVKEMHAGLDHHPHPEAYWRMAKAKAKARASRMQPPPTPAPTVVEELPPPVTTASLAPIPRTLDALVAAGSLSAGISCEREAWDRAYRVLVDGILRQKTPLFQSLRWLAAAMSAAGAAGTTGKGASSGAAVEEVEVDVVEIEQEGRDVIYLRPRANGGGGGVTPPGGSLTPQQQVQQMVSKVVMGTLMVERGGASSGSEDASASQDVFDPRAFLQQLQLPRLGAGTGTGGSGIDMGGVRASTWRGMKPLQGVQALALAAALWQYHKDAWAGSEGFQATWRNVVGGISEGLSYLNSRPVGGGKGGKE
eukprot:jgi/Mesvir1/16266/Mv08512-RA.1